MSEAKANQQEAAPDAKIASKSGSDTSTDTRATLSNSIQDMMKEAVSGGKTAADSLSSSGSTAGEGLSGIANRVGDALPTQSAEADKALANMIKNGDKISEGSIQHGEANKQVDKTSGIENVLKGGVNVSDLANFKDKVTDQDRKEAKEALEKGISGLVPEADRKLQVAMQNAIIDGDMGKFQEAVKAVGNDPEKLAKMVKEVNGELNKNEKFGGVELSMDSKGNVLLYGEKGNTAVSVNPKTGDTTLRAVERQADGSVVLKHGEIINRTPADVMKNLGDEATRSITEFPFHRLNPIEKPPFRPFPPDRGFPMPKPPGGIEGKPPSWNEKPSWKDFEKELYKESLDFTPLKGLDDKKNEK
jgi:hypothetical protein